MFYRQASIIGNMEFIDAKTIVTNTKTLNYRYIATEYVMNIYHGCSHGCVYCYARGEYYKIADFDRVKAKKDALRIIRDDLERKTKPGIVGTGGMTDHYNNEEREHKLTRSALELINAYSFGACVLTKSDLVLRDADILSDIKTHSPVCINFSITYAEDPDGLAVEPGAPASSDRFAAIKELAGKGIITGVLLDPVVPYVTDTEENIRGVVKRSKEAGASYIYASISVTMEGVQRDYFFDKMEPIHPGIREKYEKRYKNYYRCRCPGERKLWYAFADECEKQGVVHDMWIANKMIRKGYNLADNQFDIL